MCDRWQRSRHGRAIKKADTGDAAAVDKEMIQALQQSLDIKAKVGDSYKKGLKVAPRVEMFPKQLEEIQEQLGSMSKRKR